MVSTEQHQTAASGTLCSRFLRLFCPAAQKCSWASLFGLFVQPLFRKRNDLAIGIIFDPTEQKRTEIQGALQAGSPNQKGRGLPVEVSELGPDMLRQNENMKHKKTETPLL